MRVLRSLLRPGWLALAVVVVAFAALCFSVLAPWQLGKNTATSHRNDLIKSAVKTSAKPIDQVAPPGAGFRPDTEWRAVTLTGTYLPSDQAMVRLRSVEEQPAAEVLTPFRLDDGRVIAVDRGYVRSQQGSTPTAPPAPDGQVSITARIRATEGTAEGRGARIVDGTLSMYTIDPTELSTAVRTPMAPYYLLLSSGQPGSLGEIPLPQLDSGPYLSYGLQWLAFGVMAPLGLGYFVVAEVRARRRKKDAPKTAAAAAGATPSPAAANASASTNREGKALGTDRVSRRRRVREDLRGEPVSTGPATRIGQGPDAATVPDDVREKLNHRYGG